MTRVNFIGMDPGASGCLCRLQIDPDGTHDIMFLDNDANVRAKGEWLTQHSREGVQMTMIEDVHSLPTMSAKSNFTFGWNVSELHTLLQCLGMPYDMIQPKKWQSTVGIKVPTQFKGPVRAKRLKQATADKCDQLYPGCNIYGPKGGLKDGRSDALMIAHYCRMTYNN